MLSKLFEKKTDIAKPSDAGQAGQGSLLDMIAQTRPEQHSSSVDNSSVLSALSSADREYELRRRAEAVEQMRRQPMAPAPVNDLYFRAGHNGTSPGAAEQLDFLAAELNALQQKIDPGPSGQHSSTGATAAAGATHQVSSASSDTERPPEQAAGARSALSFDRVVGAVFRSWLPVAVCALAGGALAALYALSLPNKYESVAEILIEPRGLQVLNDSVAPNGLNREATLAYAESQVRIISSSSVIDPVIEDLDLVNDPEFTGSSGGLLDFVFGPTSGENPTIADAKEYFYSNFYASRVNQTFTILVGISTEDRLKSARIANAIARQYISEEAGAKSNIARDANESLTARLAELGEKLEKSQRAVEEHRRQFDLIDAEGKLVNDVQLARLNEQLALSKVQAGDARTRAEQAARADLADAISGALPSAISSNAIDQLRVEYNRAKSRLDRLETRLGNRHPDKIAAKAELASARNALAREIKRAVKAAQKNSTRAAARQLDLQKQVNTLKAAASSDSPAIVRLRELESIADADRRVYETVLLRSRETGEQVEIRSKSARVISEATPADEKLGPNRKLMVLIGLVIGAILGALFGLVPLLAGAARGVVSGNPLPAQPSTTPSSGGSNVGLWGSDDPYSAAVSAPVSPEPAPTGGAVRPSVPPAGDPVAPVSAPAQSAPQAQAGSPSHPVQMPLPGLVQQPMQPAPVMMQPPMVPQPMVQPVYVQAPPMMMAQPAQPQPIYTTWVPPQPPTKES